jgi:hypothetical protein
MKSVFEKGGGKKNQEMRRQERREKKNTYSPPSTHLQNCLLFHFDFVNTEETKEK